VIAGASMVEIRIAFAVARTPHFDAVPLPRHFGQRQLFQLDGYVRHGRPALAVAEKLIPSSDSIWAAGLAAVSVLAHLRTRRRCPKARVGRNVARRVLPSTAKDVASSSSVSQTPDLKRCYVHLKSAPENALLESLRAEVPGVLESTGASHIWGVDLTRASEGRDVVLFKFLRAEGMNLRKAVERLTSALKFRIDRQVDELARRPLAPKFQGHDAIVGTDVDGRPVMISRYGAMDNEAVFGDVEGFIDYRIHVMERAMSSLSFTAGAAEDLCQVHDYSGVPLLFKTQEVKDCVNALTKVFGAHYPETKGKTLFVNFPLTFSKLFQTFCAFLPERTRNKFLILGDSDQALLFEHLRPESVPEDLGGMLQPFLAGAETETVGGPCGTVSVSPGAMEQVCITSVDEPSVISWELRVCHGDISYDLVFVTNSGQEIVVAPRTEIDASYGVRSGAYQTTTSGTLRCRFWNDRAWIRRRLCLYRASVSAAVLSS